MDAHETEILPAIAEALSGWFPELEDRAIAVTDAKITKENMPTLPLAMVAPLRQTYTHNSGGRMDVNDDFIIEFWLKSQREVGVNGETPFWSYYDFNAFRNRLFSLFAGWRTPQNGSVRFVTFDVEADEFAVMLAFRMRAIYAVCKDDLPQEACGPDVHRDGQPARISYMLCQPRGNEAKTPGCEPPVDTEVDPCAKD